MDFILDLLSDEAVQNAILAVFGIVLTFFINRVVGIFQASTGIRIEEKHMRALHSAIMSGAAAAISRGPKDGIEQIKREALAYANKSVPDAITALVPGDGVLDRLAERYARQALDRINRL